MHDDDDDDDDDQDMNCLNMNCLNTNYQIVNIIPSLSLKPEINNKYF